MSLRVLQIAADALWIGPTREPMRRFGVPEGGPFDRLSWRWACHLAGVRAALEIGPFGGRFLAESPTTVAIVGADRVLSIDGAPTSNGRINLETGEILELGPVRQGARSYLAIRGGGGTGTPCRGDLLTGVGGDETLRLAVPSPQRITPIRLTDGPEGDAFDRTQFTETLWRVGADSDRRGLRLEGPPLIAEGSLGERLSEPQPVGTVQVDLVGKPIVIGPDGPTIGGYPRLAVVIDADRDHLGQLVPGDPVRFQFVSRDEAVAAWHDYRQRSSSIPLGA